MIGLAAGFADGFADARIDKKAKEDRAALRAKLDAITAGLGATDPNAPVQGAASGGGVGATGAVPAGDGTLAGYIDSTEGNGDYSKLYNGAEKGAFSGVDVSKMTLGDLYRFTDPSGDYGRYVKDNGAGVVATPLGRYQIVGSTLRDAATKMGLPENTVFDGATQDRIASHLAMGRVGSAETMPGKIDALRHEWVGLRSIPDEQLAEAIAKFEANGGQLSSIMPPLGATRRPI